MVPARKLCLFLVLTAIVAIAAREDRKPPIEESFPAAASAHSSERFGVAGELPPGIFLPVQSRRVHDLAPGRLLVASRFVADPHFARTVVLLIHYNEKSVAGLILNRRTNVPLSLLEKGLSGHLYIGGPVEPNSTYALLKAPGKLEGAEHIVDGVHLITSSSLFDQTVEGRPDPSVFHVYQGDAEWTPDQLEMEVARGSWFIFPASADAVFAANPETQWLEMIQKTELQMAWNAGHSGPLTPGLLFADYNYLLAH